MDTGFVAYVAGDGEGLGAEGCDFIGDGVDGAGKLAAGDLGAAGDHECCSRLRLGPGLWHGRYRGLLR